MHRSPILLSAAIFASLGFFLPEKCQKSPPGQVGKKGEFTVLKGARLKASGANDGDSFFIQHNGLDYHIRLYYVDTPETKARFDERLREQARYFDCSKTRTLEIGNHARKQTERWLKNEPFEVYTKWEKVLRSSRFYGFVRFPSDSAPSWLSERLIDQGLARIHTWESPLPNGKSRKAFRAVLEKKERTAKRNGRGAWAKN